MRNQNPRNVYMDILKNQEPLLRYKKDCSFKEWQEKARAKLRELLCLDVFEACDLDFKQEEVVEQETYTQIRFSFQSEPGYYVPAYIWIPKECEGKLTPMICLQGHSKGMHISLGQPKYPGDENTIAGGDRDFAVHALKNGYCPVVMDQRYMGECGGDEKGPGCYTRSTREEHMSVMQTLLAGRCAIGERVWDIGRMIDALGEYFPQLDMDNVMCMGNSGGGTATFYAACVDERIKAAMPSCAVCTYWDSIGARYHCACNYIPGAGRYFDMGDLGGLIAPRTLVVVSGREDKDFPLDAAIKSVAIMKELYACAGVPDNIAHVIGDEGHRFYAEAGYKTLNELVKN